MLIYFSISNLPLTTKMQLNVYTKKYSKQKEKGKPVTLKFSRKTGRTSGLEFGLFYISKEGTGKRKGFLSKIPGTSSLRNPFHSAVCLISALCL